MNIWLGSLFLAIAVVAVLALAGALIWYTGLVEDRRYDDSCDCAICEDD